MHRTIETVGVRFTGRAAINRDPLDDRIEFSCPQCGARGAKPARRPRAEYHFTDGFIQDLEGRDRYLPGLLEKALSVVPVVLLHDQDEKRRFVAVFEPNLDLSKN